MSMEGSTGRLIQPPARWGGQRENGRRYRIFEWNGVYSHDVAKEGVTGTGDGIEEWEWGCTTMFRRRGNDNNGE